MNNYALELLEIALRNELIAQEQGLAIANGMIGCYNEAGRQAFLYQLDLANERIPQLEEAIKKISH